MLKDTDVQDSRPDDFPNENVVKTTNEIEDMTSQLNVLLDNFKEQLSSGNLPTNEGISLFDVKNQLMINYLTNVTYLIAKKCHGKSIEGDGAVDRLVEIRTVLERIRPIEHKLKYMVEKLVKAAITGISDSNDPTHFRANPQNMMDNMEGSDSESDEEDEEKTSKKKSDKKSGVYVPPRLTPMHYDEEDNPVARRQRQVERAKKRALHSSVMEELKEEYLDTPVEVSHSNTLKATISKHQKHKNRYEEEYFTRLPSTKKEKHKGRHSMTVGNIADQLTHFDNIQVLEDESSFSGAKRKRKSGGKAGGKPNKKKGFKRRKTR